MEDDNGMIEISDLLCKVCGENNFDMRAGYYYCQECGTKQDQVRDIEVDRENEFKESQHAVKHTIQKEPKIENDEITSWECFNYILRGMVEDLLSLGAKDDLKLMALQIWSAYLRRCEVAFFNKKQSDLPRLGIRYHQRDARTLYNHAVKKHKSSRKKKTALNGNPVKSLQREWKKNKRKLDESAYSQESIQISQTNSKSSVSGNSIQLKYTTQAQKTLKKKMPLKHLPKHTLDADGKLKCHKLRIKSTELGHFQRVTTTMCMKKIYTILAIALNLIGDDIQLSDLARFIAEQHITSKNVLKYLPESIAAKGKKILSEIDFNFYHDKYSHKILRRSISYMARFININAFKIPDIFGLAQRYITDLNLPADFGKFVERLINVLPPEMSTHATNLYPQYEARAMAYIVFVLKILFGLDGQKEELISQAAAKVNANIQKAKKSKQVGGDESHALLFVWTDWLEYIEMRKVIISQYNTSFSRQFEQQQSMSQLVADIDTKHQAQIEQQDTNQKEVGESNTIKKQLENMKIIFENFIEKQKTENFEHVEAITFQPSLTPSNCYFKRLLLHASTVKNSQIKIPKFMRLDHTKRTITPYIDTKTLIDYLNAHNIHLKIQKLSCNSERKYVGIFRSAIDAPFTMKLQKADHLIREEDWLEDIEKEKIADQLIFKTTLEKYGKAYLRIFEKNAKKMEDMQNSYKIDFTSMMQAESAKNNISNLPKEIVANSSAEFENRTSQQQQQQTQPEAPNQINDIENSFEIFSEYNMNPIETDMLKTPRRHLDTSSLSNIDKRNSAGAPVCNSKDERSNNVLSQQCATLLTSEFDYWILMGHTSKMKESSLKILKSKLPRSFFWLLETCAQTIGVDWIVIYEQLLVIELMFTHGLENLNEFDTCLRYTYRNPIKDLNILTNLSRDTW